MFANKFEDRADNERIIEITKEIIFIIYFLYKN